MQIWKAAQLMFSLSISVALFSQSPFGFPFAVIGFWKCGFPETTGCFRRAFRLGKINIESVVAYMNGVGTLIHHTSGAYLIVACATHLTPLDRRTLACSMPLVAQHLVVLFRYWNTAVYGVCELTIEILWEWEIFSNLGDFSIENGYDVTTRGICLTMVFAHWMYWSAALIGAFAPAKKKATDELRDLAKDMDDSGLDFDESAPEPRTHTHRERAQQTPPPVRCPAHQRSRGGAMRARPAGSRSSSPSAASASARGSSSRCSPSPTPTPRARSTPTRSGPEHAAPCAAPRSPRPPGAPPEPRATALALLAGGEAHPAAPAHGARRRRGGRGAQRRTPCHTPPCGPAPPSARAELGAPLQRMRARAACAGRGGLRGSRSVQHDAGAVPALAALPRAANLGIPAAVPPHGRLCLQCHECQVEVCDGTTRSRTRPAEAGTASDAAHGARQQQGGRWRGGRKQGARASRCA